MKHKLSTVVLLVFSILALSSCGEWSFDTYWRSDGYRLIAIDAKSQMSLIFEKDHIALIGPTIFAIGSNENIIVVKQHPAIDPWASKFDRSITNYFVVERRLGSSLERSEGVRGPFEHEEFERLFAKLSLPAFTKTFDDLE